MIDNDDAEMYARHQEWEADKLERSLADVGVLWPYLSMAERSKWVDLFRHHFDDDFSKTVQAITQERPANA